MNLSRQMDQAVDWIAQHPFAAVLALIALGVCIWLFGGGTELSQRWENRRWMRETGGLGYEKDLRGREVWKYRNAATWAVIIIMLVVFLILVFGN